jgi:hypothetical protein
MHSEKVAGALALNKKPPFFLYTFGRNSLLLLARNHISREVDHSPLSGNALEAVCNPLNLRQLLAQVQFLPGGGKAVDVLGGEERVPMPAGGAGRLFLVWPLLGEAVDTLASESFDSLLFFVNASIDHTYIIGN